MNQGYFFQLEKNSKQAEGAVVFRYLPIKVANTYDAKKYSIPQYPIYLVIKSSAIDFYFHGISYSNVSSDNEKEKDTNANHVNIRLLHLPLSKNIAVKDNLTSILINCYELEYNINSIYESYDESSIDSDIICYSNLEVFNSEKEIKYKEPYISFKRLFLDFMFDLEHSKVFENSPHYEEAEIHLVENLFFHYIANKAAFYYEWGQYINKANTRDQDAHVHSLKEKEKQWVESCIDNRSPVMFEESEGWFKPVEDEMKKILFRKKRRDWIKQLIDISKKETKAENFIADYKAKIDKIKKGNSKLLINSSKWFLRRYNFDDAISSLLLIFSNRPLLILSIIFLFLPFIFFLFSQKGFFYEINILRILILMAIPSILICLKLLSRYKNKNILPEKTAFQIPPFTLLIGISWIVFILLFDFIFWENFDSFSESMYTHSIFILIVFILFIGLIILFIVKGIFLTIVSIFLPRLIIGLFGAWFFMLTTEELILANFDRLLEWQDILLLFFLALIMLFFIMNQIKSINKADLSLSNCLHAVKLFERSLAFLTFSFFISLIIGQLSINIFVKKTITRSEYLETYFKEISIERCDETIKSEVQKFQAGELTNIKRDDLFDLLSNVYGHENTNIRSDKFLFLASLSLPLLNYKLSFIIFPKMLIFLAVFALFFGVFIQLIFEDKPVTEPL